MRWVDRAHANVRQVTDRQVERLLLPSGADITEVGFAVGRWGKPDGDQHPGQGGRSLRSGLYRYDTVFIAEGSRGTDGAVVPGIPLLVVATLWAYRRGSSRGVLLLAGAIAYVLCVYASRALSSAYDPSFLLYIVVFSANTFAVLLVVIALRRAELDQRVARSARIAVCLVLDGLWALFEAG